MALHYPHDTVRTLRPVLEGGPARGRLHYVTTAILTVTTVTTATAVTVTTTFITPIGVVRVGLQSKGVSPQRCDSGSRDTPDSAFCHRE